MTSTLCILLCSGWCVTYTILSCDLIQKVSQNKARKILNKIICLALKIEGEAQMIKEDPKVSIPRRNWTSPVSNCSIFNRIRFYRMISFDGWCISRFHICSHHFVFLSFYSFIYVFIYFINKNGYSVSMETNVIDVCVCVWVFWVFLLLNEHISINWTFFYVYTYPQNIQRKN